MSDLLKEKGFVVAIDGPVAAGKGTIAKELATLLNGVYIDSGAMYRAVTYYCMKHGIGHTDISSIKQVLPNLDIQLEDSHVLLNGEDISSKIRTQEISTAVSKFAVHQIVQEDSISRRRKLADRLIGKGTVVVSEGRNEGTAAFPNAAVKIYLTASVETRARRRLQQLLTAGNTDVTFDKVLQDTKLRDTRDMNRTSAPLVKNPELHGYSIIDDSSLNERQTLEKIVFEIKKKGLCND